MNNFRLNTATTCHLIVISVLGALIYSNTLTAAFQFDDKLNIVDNLFIRDIRNLWPPAGARWFGLLTFSLNYMAGGLNPVGYHLVNICIHILTGLSVYLFVILTLRTPYFGRRTDTIITDGWLAFACALLFVAHPIQTQAVTYIVQRFASLASLLFMFSFNLYIMARLTTADRYSSPSYERFRHLLTKTALYVAAGLCALLSLKTKENTYTLPVVLLTYDLMFISGLSQLSAAIKKRWQVVVSVSVLILLLFVFMNSRYGLDGVFDKLKATNEISRHDYLVTQFRVIVTYIRLLFFPVNQTLDHHYRVFRSLFAPDIIASLAFIVLLAGTGVYLYMVSRNRNRYLRLVSFGIFWFFTTLSVESSIIPIIDVMFEHRLYLPSIGAILAVSAAFVYALEITTLDRIQVRMSAACILVALIIVLSYTAHVRNRVWKSELTLWSDVITKTPRNPRGYNMVGSYYQANFRMYDAIYYFSKALEVDSSYAEARSNLGNAYILTGRIDEGLNELMITSKNNRFDEIDTGILYYNIGRGYLKKGLPEPALDNLNRALRYIPNEPAVYSLLGEVFQQKNMPEQSSAHFKKAHELDPARY